MGDKTLFVRPGHISVLTFHQYLIVLIIKQNAATCISKNDTKFHEDIYIV